MAASEVEVVPASNRDSGSESEVQQTSGTSNTTVVSLLDRLKAPKPSDLSRKRKVDVNPPCGKRSCKSTNVATAVGTVQPQRVAEYSDSTLQDYIEASLMLQYNSDSLVLPRILLIIACFSH